MSDDNRIDRTGDKWYVVPSYRTDGRRSTCAQIVDSCGQCVAQFELIEHAELVARMYNTVRPDSS